MINILSKILFILSGCALLIFGIILKNGSMAFGLFALIFIAAILAQAGEETLPLTRVKIKNGYLRLIF
ncbi:hypothetical protein [Bacillus velezensis]|uniref:hypothetical protein n=1 Tax=Bacillus velezensis TaxID=492670 RepID=UPI000F42BE6E|nr:hypothetical protein [Bacillus velezensis]AYV19344.1 hypothetical protein EEB07_19085 [Bacillus velezensis]